MSRRLFLVPAGLAASALLVGCGTASTPAASPASAAGAPVKTQPQPATAPATTGLGSFDQALLAAGATRSQMSAIIPPNSPKAHASAPASQKSTPSPSKSTSTGGSNASSGSSSGGSGSGQPATITHTVTVPGPTVVERIPVRPDVPAGAGVPSALPALPLSSFVAEEGNIGCVISSGSVRCDVAHRVWTPPRKPASCDLAWGQGITVSGDQRPSFVCAADSVLNPSRQVVPVGDDDTVGAITCQVRSVGVTCFTTAGHGFFISRTGYTLF